VQIKLVGLGTPHSLVKEKAGRLRTAGNFRSLHPAVAPASPDGEGDIYPVFSAQVNRPGEEEAKQASNSCFAKREHK
jgi:hypothetical protein